MRSRAEVRKRKAGSVTAMAWVKVWEHLVPQQESRAILHGFPPQINTVGTQSTKGGGWKDWRQQDAAAAYAQIGYKPEIGIS